MGKPPKLSVKFSPASASKVAPCSIACVSRQPVLSRTAARSAHLHVQDHPFYCLFFLLLFLFCGIGESRAVIALWFLQTWMGKSGAVWLPPFLFRRRLERKQSENSVGAWQGDWRPHLLLLVLLSCSPLPVPARFLLNGTSPGQESQAASKLAKTLIRSHLD